MHEQYADINQTDWVTYLADHASSATYNILSNIYLSRLIQDVKGVVWIIGVAVKWRSYLLRLCLLNKRESSWTVPSSLIRNNQQVLILICRCIIFSVACYVFRSSIVAIFREMLFVGMWHGKLKRYTDIKCCILGKIKFTLKQATKAQRGSRSIIIIIIIIKFNCKWAVTRWQWLLCMHINMK